MNAEKDTSYRRIIRGVAIGALGAAAFVGMKAVEQTVTSISAIQTGLTDASRQQIHDYMDTTSENFFNGTDDIAVDEPSIDVEPGKATESMLAAESAAVYWQAAGIFAGIGGTAMVGGGMFRRDTGPTR